MAATRKALPAETIARIKELNAQGLGPTAIGERMALPKSTTCGHTDRTVPAYGDWTPARIELLTKLWLDGKSAGEIAGRPDMPFSRSAVIGKVYRLGLTRRAELNEQATIRGQRTRHGDVQRAAKTPRAPRPKVTVTLVPASTPAAPAGPVNPEPRPLREVACGWAPSNPVPMGDQRRGHCAWPIEIEGEPLKACNEAVTGRWCAAHGVIGSKPNSPPKTREPAAMNFSGRAPARFLASRGGYE